MKINIYIKSILIISLLIISDPFNTFSQGTDINLGKKAVTYFSFNAGINKSQISNEGIPGISNLLSSKGSSIGVSACFGYVLPSRIGFSAGIGYSPYKTDLSLETYQTNYTTKDSENESYERRVSGTTIKEEQSIGFLSFPLCFNYSIPINESFGILIEPGIILAIPLNKEYSSSGTFTTRGYYPSYNVLLENLPQYGFASNKSINTAGELEIKSLVLTAKASAGVEYQINENIKIGAAICYTRSLSDISGYTSPEKFQLVSNEDQLNSLMGGADKVTTSSLGLGISLKYYLK